VETTIKTNFFSTLNVCKYLFPLLAKDAKVVHISSGLAMAGLSALTPALRQQFLSITKMQDLESLMSQYVKDIKEGTYKEKGWPHLASYNISKLGVNVMTKIQASELNEDARNVVVNCCTPGFVATDMNNNTGVKTVQQGAITPCHLALLTSKQPYGQYMADLKVVDWEHGQD